MFRSLMRTRTRTGTTAISRGSVTIELGVVAPVFLALIAGVSEASRLLETQNLLASVAREGAQLAAMDRSIILEPGQTTNEKIETDIKNFLSASGLSGDGASVQIVDPDDHTTPMDLDDPATELKLFELRVELPYSAIYGAGTDSELNLTANIVFRNAPATFGQ